MSFIHDFPAVRVWAGGDFDTALRILKKKVDIGGNLRILKLRELNPSTADRRRAKRRLTRKRNRGKP